MSHEIKQPFTGRELYSYHQANLHGWSIEACEQAWEEEIGKTKKQTWNAMASMINERMKQEIANHE